MDIRKYPLRYNPVVILAVAIWTFNAVLFTYYSQPKPHVPGVADQVVGVVNGYHPLP